MATRPARSDGELSLRQGAKLPTSAGTHFCCTSPGARWRERPTSATPSAPGPAGWSTPGLNVVVLTLRIRPPWGDEPLGCPINVRLFHKGEATHNELDGGRKGSPG
jgi:hypothetical protein